MKWIELTVTLADDTKFNEVLSILVKPYINSLRNRNIDFNWHFFREPSLCWRIYSNKSQIIKSELDIRLKELEESNSEIFKNHYFGAFLIDGKEYNGESELYGTDAWELCYKRWETGSNLALLLCTTEPMKSLPFHYTRDIHLMENQLGFELPDAITIYLKWLKTLMGCDNYYKPYLETMSELIKNTCRKSSIKGI
ncbi:hypothetical protein LCGC14_2278900 [marine sediment metagenome]|uniref:Thiopeptide-type bacteriocin biosynthesis domain-containing protein n=1 Tax=marine sediment metagenome TaxID=412755 RepID=A0A0F9FPU9_9ZZZZ